MIAGIKERITAITLIVVMLFTLCGSVSFADENDQKEGKKLVVIGASTANGYGLSDFVNIDKGFNVKNNDLEGEWTVEAAKENEMGRLSEKAYPWKLKKYLEETEGVPYDLTSFAMNGMRTDELRAMLDEDFYRKSFEHEKAKTWYYGYNEDGKEVLMATGFLSEHVNNFVQALGHGGATVEEGGKEVPVWTEEDNINIDGHIGVYGLEGNSGKAYRRAQKYVTEQIKSADVLVVDNVMNNFGTYLAHRVGSIAGTPGFEASKLYSKQTLEDIDDISGTTWKQVGKLKDALMGFAGLSNNALGKEMINAFLYCYADAVTNFSAEMDLIRELNPDAKIIVVGPYNSLAGVNLKFGGQTVALGTIAGKAFDMVSAYLKAVDKHSTDYYFADLSVDIETFMTKMAKTDTYENFMKDPEGAELLNNMYEGSDSSFLETLIGTSDPEKLPDALAASQFDSIDLEEDMEPDEDYEDPDLVDVFLPMIKDHWNDYLVKYEGLLTEEEKDPTSKYITWKDLHTLQSLGTKEIDRRTDEEGLGQEILETQFFGINSMIELMMNGIHEGEMDFDGIIDTIPKMKPAMQKIMFDAAKVDTLDLTAIASTMQSMKTVKKQIMAVVTKGNEPTIEVLSLFHILDRFLLYMSIGQHPDEAGCDQIYQIVKGAYEKDDSAYEETKTEIAAELDKLAEMLRQKGAGEQVDKIIERINQIDAALDMIDEAQAGLEELKKIQALRARLEEYVGQTLDLLGITVDDLAKAGDFVKDNVDPVWVAEQIKLLNDIIMNWPDGKEEYKEKIEELVQEMYDKLDEVIDDIINNEDMFDDNETMKKIIDTIKILRDAVESMPKSEEEFKEMLIDKIDDLEKVIEDKAAEISEDLAAQVREIADKLKDAVSEADYKTIIDELMPIGEKLLAIGQAVTDLPEFEEAMNEYLETSKAAQEGLDERVKALEEQAAKLQAKYIDVELKTALKLGAKSSSVTVSFDLDDAAAGYDLKVNGKEVELQETASGLAYEQKGIKIGSTYKYEVTPYILAEVNGETKTVYGQTFTKTFVPKVKLKKVTLKNVKPAKKSFKATWKKTQDADGYQLSYKLGKKTISKNVKGAKKVKLTVKKLKKGKKYTVKVRAWKTVNGKKYFGTWSKAKKAKIK